MMLKTHGYKAIWIYIISGFIETRKGAQLIVYCVEVSKSFIVTRKGVQLVV